MLSEKPLVSIIITTYNRKGIIQRAIESVYSQTYKNIELLIIDDNSDYNIRDHLSYYYHKDNFHIYENEENLGANASRCKGIRKSKGRYVAFLDDDDMWKESKLEKQLEKMAKFDELVTITSGRELINSDVEIKPKKKYASDNLIKRLLMRENPVGGFSNILVDREVIKKTGTPDPKLDKFQDVEWYIRLAQNSTFYSVQEPLVKYDDDPQRNRMSNINIIKKDKSHKYIIDKHSNLIDNQGPLEKKKIYSSYYYRKSENRFKIGDYYGSKRWAIEAIIKYPPSMKAHLIFILSLFGDAGYQMGKKLKKIYNTQTK